jgi:hypothetical protein
VVSLLIRVVVIVGVGTIGGLIMMTWNNRRDDELPDAVLPDSMREDRPQSRSE